MPRRTSRWSAIAPAALAPVVSSALVTLAAGCGGSGGGARFAAPADVPPDLLTRSPEGQRAVIVRDGVAYLFLRQLSPYAEEGDAVELPACWTSGEDPATCDRTAPVPADAAPAGVPSTLTVLGADGPCSAQVGAPVLVNTSGCEPSAMVAAPLAGCPLDVAPVGRVDGAFDRELRWRAAPAVSTVPLFADPAKLADPVHRRYVTGWLAEDELEAGTPREGLTARVRVDAGAEALESVVAGFLVGDGDNECEWQTGSRGAVGIRRGDTFTPLPAELPREWDGAITWRGRVVGVVAGLPRDVYVHAIAADGTTATAFEQGVWWDNEECTQGGWAYVEYPCGP
jgi:hypothetical protein